MEAVYWGRRIRAFRKLKGYTQESFAKKIHVSVSVLGDIERGNRLPDESLLVRITETLNISMDELKPKQQER